MLTSRSMPRHWRMSTSSCAQTVPASALLSTTSRAPLSTTASTSAIRLAIWASREIATMPSAATRGIQSTSSMSELVIAQGGRCRLWTMAPGSPGKVASETQCGDGLAETEDVGVEVVADSCLSHAASGATREFS